MRQYYYTITLRVIMGMQSLLLLPFAHSIAQHHLSAGPSAVHTTEEQRVLPTITTLANTGVVVTLADHAPAQFCHPQHSDPTVVRHFGAFGPSVAIHAVCRTAECGQVVHMPAILQLLTLPWNTNDAAERDLP